MLLLYTIFTTLHSFIDVCYYDDDACPTRPRNRGEWSWSDGPRLLIGYSGQARNEAIVTFF